MAVGAWWKVGRQSQLSRSYMEDLLRDSVEQVSGMPTSVGIEPQPGRLSKTQGPQVGWGLPRSWASPCVI